MTPAKFSSLEKSLVIGAIVAAVAFAVILWDYLILLPGEIKLYRASRHGAWRSLSSWAFIILRYSAFLAAIPTLFLTSIPNNNCETALAFAQIGSILVVVSSGAIFAFHAVALWGDKMIIYSILGTVYTVMFGCWISVATQYRATTGPPLPFGTNCKVLPVVSWSLISYSSSVAFDVVIIILTLLKLIVNRTQHLRIETHLYRVNLGYLGITAITNIVVLIIHTLGPDQDQAKRSAASFATLIAATMGARVFLNLRVLTEHQERVNRGLPYASSGGSQDRPLYRVSYGQTVTGAYTSPPTPVPKSGISTDTKKDLNPYTTFPSPPYSPSTFDNSSFGGSPLNKKSKKGSTLGFSQQPHKSGWAA